MEPAHENRALDILRTIDSRDAVPVRELLGGEWCESDVHGICAEFRAAGLLEACEIAGERGYRTTEEAHEALSRVRDA